MKTSLRQIAIATLAVLPAAAAVQPRTGSSFYNDGVQKLQNGELREAESLLRSAVSTGDDRALNPALYNLGHVRFAQGKETLNGEGNRRALVNEARSAVAAGDQARASGAEALEGGTLESVIGAYQGVRAARKQLRLSAEAATRTQDLQTTAAGKWERSVGDFRSAVELEPKDKDADFNAEVVEKHLAALKRAMDELKQEQEKIQQMRDELKKMSGALKKKIPKEMMQESDGEEEDEEEGDEEEKKKEPKPGEKQQQRIGGERQISQEMAEWLKEMLKPRTMSIGPDGQPNGKQEDAGGPSPGDLLPFGPGGLRPDPNSPFGPGGQRDGRDGGDKQPPRGKKGKDW